MGKIKIGWSEKNLIPEGVKINLAGQFYERITDVVETPLTVTALALECDGEEAIFCSCDLVSVSYFLVESVRARLEKIEGFPTSKLLVSAIHSHTSLQYARRSDYGMLNGTPKAILDRFVPGGMKYEETAKASQEEVFGGEEAHEYLADKIAEAAVEAWKNKKEGLYASAFGRAAVGHCRRVCYDDGSAKMWGDTNMANFEALEAGSDSGIELLFTYDENKKLTGVIANIACPAQVLEHRTIISADYWGYVKKSLREAYGDDIFLLSLCSAAGDQCPRDMVRWVEPETPINDPNIVRENVIDRIADPSMFDIKGCKLAARRITDEIKYALEDVESYVDETTLMHSAFKMDIPVRRVTPEDVEKATEEIEKFVSQSGGVFDYRGKAKMHLHAGTISRYEVQQEINMTEIEVHVIRLGDIAFASNPYELFLDYGNKIRARSKAKQTFLIQLCCGTFGYLPTKKAIDGKHYSAYVTSGSTDHIGGDMLVRKTLTEINELWK